MPTKVAVVRCDSYDYELVYQKVKEAIDLIGGIGIKKGAKVLIKPNLLGGYLPNEAITTHPAVVDSICRILKRKNAKILIGDSCGMGVLGGTRQVLESTGMTEVARKYDAKAIALETKCMAIQDNKAKILKEIIISSHVKEADFIVNVPKLKTHTLMKYTGAVKNMFGIVPGANKAKYHSIAPREKEFGELLVDIFQNAVPHLSIMDGIIGIEGNGPGAAGSKKKAGIILASKNAVALDFVASGIIGYGPDQVHTNVIAKSRGLFDGSYDIIGEKNIKIPFKKPMQPLSLVPPEITRFVFEYLKLSPYVMQEKCVACKTCYIACPAKTISMNKTAHINLKKCIRCYCCHELCPHKAIELRMPFVFRFLSAARKKLKI